MYWLIGIVVAMAAAAYIKRRVDAVPDPSRVDIAKTITDFLEGRGGEYDWDNVATYPLKDPELEKIRKECYEVWVRYPSEKKTQWCRDEGMRELRRIRDRIVAEV